MTHRRTPTMLSMERARVMDNKAELLAQLNIISNYDNSIDALRKIEVIRHFLRASVVEHGCTEEELKTILEKFTIRGIPIDEERRLALVNDLYDLIPSSRASIIETLEEGELQNDPIQPMRQSQDDMLAVGDFEEPEENEEDAPIPRNRIESGINEFQTAREKLPGTNVLKRINNMLRGRKTDKK